MTTQGQRRRGHIGSHLHSGSESRLSRAGRLTASMWRTVCVVWHFAEGWAGLTLWTTESGHSRAEPVSQIWEIGTVGALDTGTPGLSPVWDLARPVMALVVCWGKWPPAEPLRALAEGRQFADGCASERRWSAPPAAGRLGRLQSLFTWGSPDIQRAWLTGFYWEREEDEKKSIKGLIKATSCR